MAAHVLWKGTTLDNSSGSLSHFSVIFPGFFLENFVDSEGINSAKKHAWNWRVREVVSILRTRKLAYPAVIFKGQGRSCQSPKGPKKAFSMTLDRLSTFFHSEDRDWNMGSMQVRARDRYAREKGKGIAGISTFFSTLP